MENFNPDYNGLIAALGAIIGTFGVLVLIAIIVMVIRTIKSKRYHGNKKYWHPSERPYRETDD
jgi:hypothetical protein